MEKIETEKRKKELKAVLCSWIRIRDILARLNPNPEQLNRIKIWPFWLENAHNFCKCFFKMVQFPFENKHISLEKPKV